MDNREDWEKVREVIYEQKSSLLQQLEIRTLQWAGGDSSPAAEWHTQLSRPSCAPTDFLQTRPMNHVNSNRPPAGQHAGECWTIEIYPTPPHLFVNRWRHTVPDVHYWIFLRRSHDFIGKQILEGRQTSTGKGKLMRCHQCDRLKNDWIPPHCI